MQHAVQGDYILSPTCRRRGTADDEDGNPQPIEDEEDEESDDWCATM